MVQWSVISLAEFYPEVACPDVSASARFEAWLDLARQGLLAAWMLCFESRCYFYRLGEIHEYSDCLMPTQAEPERHCLAWVQEALEQALILSQAPEVQYCLGLVGWLQATQPEERQVALQKMAQFRAQTPSLQAEAPRFQRFLQKSQTLPVPAQMSVLQALKQDSRLRESLGFDLPLPTFPLAELVKLPLSATQSAGAFAARLRLLLGEDPPLAAQMGWRVGLIRMLMESEKMGVAGHWQIRCFGPAEDPFLAQARRLGTVQNLPESSLEPTEQAKLAELVTLWHLNGLDERALAQIQVAWQGLSSSGLLLAAFARSTVEPAELRRALADLTGAEVDLIDRESFCDRLVVVIWKKAMPPIEKRVLILMRPDSALSFGGADLQMFRSRARLRVLGVQTDISLACRLDFEAYDLIYAVGYLHEQYQFRLLHATAKPVVGMPIATLFYLESALAEEIYSQIHLQVGSQLNQASAVSPHLLQWLKNWHLAPLWQKVGGDWQKVGMKAKIDKISGQFATACDFLVPQAQAEMAYLQSHSSQPLPPYRLLPNGCDPELYAQADPTLFENTHGLSDFLLCVGRIEPNKNQLLLCYALRETDIPIVLVGKESADLFADYLALCHYLGNGRVHVLQDLSDAMLASAYAAARLFVLPSASESFPLSTLEAAWVGCPVVLSQNSVQGAFFQDCFYLADPLAPHALKAVIETAWEADNQARIATAQARVKQLCTWEQMARDLKQVFDSTEQWRQAQVQDQPGQITLWEGEALIRLYTALIPPTEGPLRQVYRLSDLSPVWALKAAERAPYLPLRFDVYSDLARFYLQNQGFQQVQMLPLLTEALDVTNASTATQAGPHLLCLYHPLGYYGHAETVAAFLQAFPASSPARLSLYLPDGDQQLEELETALLEQIADLGHDPEAIPELAVVGGGLSPAEEQALWASASLIVFPLKQLWGQEALLARLLASGRPLLTQGFQAHWPDPERGIQILTAFEQLCQAPPDALIAVEVGQLATVFQTLSSVWGSARAARPRHLP